MSNPPIRRPGQFTTPEDLAKQVLAEETAPAAEAVVEDVAEPPSDKTPMERWLETIQAAGLTEAEADSIIDALLQQGFYEKTYKLFRGKLSVTMRSRDASSVQRVSEALDRVKTNDTRIHQQTINRHNLAATLVKYQDKVFKFPTAATPADERENMYYERLTFIDKLPGPVLVQLYAVLGKFDSIVFSALSEGAELGF